MCVAGNPNQAQSSTYKKQREYSTWDRKRAAGGVAAGKANRHLLPFCLAASHAYIMPSLASTQQYLPLIDVCPVLPFNLPPLLCDACQGSRGGKRQSLPSIQARRLCTLSSSPACGGSDHHRVIPAAGQNRSL